MAPERINASLLDIIDIRRGEIEFNLLDEINAGLNPPAGRERSLPSMIFYDEKGLRLFEEITYLDEYYLTNAEIEVLETHVSEIAKKIQQGSQVIELGSGNLRKVKILLDALERSEKEVDYYALDLSLNELHRTLGAVPSKIYSHVKIHGLHGTYDDGFEWFKAPQNTGRPKCIMSLGSSIGNFTRAEALGFLRKIAHSLSPADTMIIAVDGCHDVSRVYSAYNDRRGITHKFIRNGLDQVNRLLGRKLFNEDDWSIVGEFDSDECRHQVYVVPNKDVFDGTTLFPKGEGIHVEDSHKYPPDRMSKLWNGAGLTLRASFVNSRNDYHINMLSLIPTFPTDPVVYAAAPCPSLKEYERLWATWDTVRSILREEDLLTKPINLRNCCLFYLGHIPGFLEIHLNRSTNGKPTEPAAFQKLFERGIDPNVENPELCHAHSEMPDNWPPVEEMIKYQDRVRDRVRALYAAGEPSSNLKLAYSLWLGFEHEALHHETYLFMLRESDRTLLPPGEIPDFKSLAKQAKDLPRGDDWVEIPKRGVEIGKERNELDSPDDFFAWDNEMPTRKAHVPAFEARPYALTNEEYARYLLESGIERYPTSWLVKSSEVNEYHTNGNELDVESKLPESFLSNKFVKTIYGPVPLELALDWPATASYDELAGCAQWMGGRVPSLEETHSIYEYVEDRKRSAKGISFMSPHTIPAVNGHLSNGGVEESPPQKCGRHSGAEHGALSESHSLFVDLEGCNVGFKNWYPVPVNLNVNGLAGRAEMGGVWEWTSSVLERWEDFEPMEAYPVYTADFFDGKHNIMLGGSWATHPRIAGRKSFVNFFQRSYPYVWGGARVVRDIGAQRH